MSARLEVITGPMRSGKSEELIRRLKRVKIASQKAIVLKPHIDVRTSATEIASREFQEDKPEKIARFPAVSVGTLKEFREAFSTQRFDVLAIDEAQFFTQSWFLTEIKRLLLERADSNFRIIVSGLDLTAQLEPFGPMPQLLAMADEVHKITAICDRCKAPACLTKKMGGSDEEIQIGDDDLYEPRCRPCHAKD